MQNLTKQQTTPSSTKTTKRSREKYPALQHSFTLKRRADLIDYDYLDKLNEEELTFLNRFTEETVSARFEKNNSKNLIKKVKDKKEVYKTNNRRNNDAMVMSKLGNALKYISTDTDSDNNYVTTDIADKSPSIDNKLEALDMLRKLNIDMEDFERDSVGNWYKIVEQKDGTLLKIPVKELEIKFNKI